MLLSVSHEEPVWFPCPISLYQVRPPMVKTSSLILLHFAINLLKGFAITSPGLNEAGMSFDLQPFVLRCMRFINVSKGFQIQIYSDTNSKTLTERLLSLYK